MQGPLDNFEARHRVGIGDILVVEGCSAKDQWREDLGECWPRECWPKDLSHDVAWDWMMFLGNDGGVA